MNEKVKTMLVGGVALIVGAAGGGGYGMMQVDDGRDAKIAGRSRLGAGARRTQAGRCSGICRCCVRARCTACRYQEVNLERVIRITAHRTRCAVFIAGGNRDSR